MIGKVCMYKVNSSGPFCAECSMVDACDTSILVKFEEDVVAVVTLTLFSLYLVHKL